MNWQNISNADSIVEKRKECVRCAQLFDPLSNIGRHACRFHPKNIVENSSEPTPFPIGTYACCGFSNDPDRPPFNLKTLQGCTPCDHVYDGEYMRNGSVATVAFRFNDEDAIPLQEMPPGSRIYTRSIEKIESEEGEIVLIHRYDREVARNRILYGNPLGEGEPLNRTETYKFGKLVLVPFVKLENTPI